MKSLIKRKMISIILAFSLAASSISGLPMNAFAETTYVTIEAPAYLTGDGAADVWDLFAEKSKAFKSNIQIAANGMIVNGRISQKIMSLGIKEKTKVTISADGDDATEAVSTLQKLISTFVNMPVSNNAMITEGRLLASTPVSNNAIIAEEISRASMPVSYNAMKSYLAIKNKLDMPLVVFYNAESPTLKPMDIETQGAQCTLKYEVVEGNEDGTVTVDGNGNVKIDGSKYADNCTRLVKIKVTANESKSDSYELLIVKMTSADDLLLAAAVEIAHTAAAAAEAAVDEVRAVIDAIYTAARAVAAATGADDKAKTEAGAVAIAEVSKALRVAESASRNAARAAAVANAYDAVYAAKYAAEAAAAAHNARTSRVDRADAAASRAADAAARARFAAARADEARAAAVADIASARADEARAARADADAAKAEVADIIAVAVEASSVAPADTIVAEVTSADAATRAAADADAATRAAAAARADVAAARAAAAARAVADGRVNTAASAAVIAAAAADKAKTLEAISTFAKIVNVVATDEAIAAGARAAAARAAAYAYKDIESKGVTDTSKARIAHLMFEVVEWWKSIFNALE